MVELPVDIKLRLDFKQFPLKMQKKKFPRISNKQNTSELCVDVDTRRRFNVDTTCDVVRRCIDVETTSCVYWE